MLHLNNLLEFFLNIDVHLNSVIQNYGGLTYLVLFLTIFAETGFVIFPFLPGDSLLFAAGAFASQGSLNIFWLWLFLSVAAIIGDTINYLAGKRLGPKIFTSETNRFLNKDYLNRAANFYERHGTKTIVIARFLPIIRTFAPFVAGIGRMNYSKFITYNISGALIWVTLFLFAGYRFGNLPVVRENFTTVVFVIIAISILPTIIELIRHRSRKTG